MKKRQILQFHEVRLSWGLHGNGENVPVGLQDGMDDTLSVYTHGGPDATLVKTLRQATGHLPVAPLLVPSNQVCIHVVTHERIPQKDNKNTETPGKRPKFSLTYTAQLLETLPPVVSGGRYDCSPPYVVPQALRCDMVEQCVGGEDEKDFNCTYWDDECKDRISGTYACLKFIFAEKPISWDEAYTACRTHQSLLLEIIDTVTKQLVNNITALSGQDDVVASFKRNPIFQFLDAQFDDFVKTKLRHLQNLKLVATGIENIAPDCFKHLPKLEILDMRNNKFTFEKKSFSGLSGLETLYTDDPRVCCSYSDLYPASKMDCVAPEDELSSCRDLLRSDFFRAVLWVLSFLSLFGNMGVFVFRVWCETQGTSPAFRVLVANLCVSDFLMGVYLMMIGSADALYRGDYLWQSREWIHSTACRAAGFLALLSSEVSAFIICLITVDRLMVLRAPLNRDRHFTARSAMMACGAAWLVGVVLASVPLLANDGEWEFYSQNGICLPLPITRHHFPGQHYAFGVFIVLNFLLFLFIGAGQLLIYQTIRSTPMAGGSQRRQQDMAIARRLFLIVFTDFCCWFPIGLMGLLASRGTPIPGVVNVWSAIVVMPLNSAINPFLYTINMLLERRRKLREQQRTQTILDRLHVDIVTWPKDKLEELAGYLDRAMEKFRCPEHPTGILPEYFGTDTNELREVGTSEERRIRSILDKLQAEIVTCRKDKLQAEIVTCRKDKLQAEIVTCRKDKLEELDVLVDRCTDTVVDVADVSTIQGERIKSLLGQFHVEIKGKLQEIIHDARQSEEAPTKIEGLTTNRIQADAGTSPHNGDGIQLSTFHGGCQKEE
nr:hypothetical protein BaRGS_027663 [Batillaria attramentaria]